MKRPRRKGTLSAIRPNIGIAAAYRRKLAALIEEMSDSYEYWLRAQYRETPPALAQDATPAKELEKELRKLGKQWQKRFDDAAPKLAAWFAKRVRGRSEAALRKILKDAGFSVKYTLTSGMRDIMAATVAENVSLIRSISQQYHTEVQGMVMRSVTAGRDLSQLSKDLRKRYGITQRRANLISLDQNNKATAALMRVRQTDMGLEEGIWLHSHAGKEPRKTHLRNHGKKFDLRTGWYDPDPRVKRHILPGELIRCFPASTRIEFAADVEKAYRRRYCGELTEVITDSGKSFRATPNHPVLTLKGWAPVGSLHKGDYIIEVADHVVQSIVSEGHANNAVATIAEIFDTVKKLGISRSEISLSDDFHGDGRANGNVDIVLAARALHFGRDAGCIKSVLNLCLAVAHQTTPGVCTFQQLGIVDFDTAARKVSRFSQALAASLPFPFHPFRVGRTSIAYDTPGGFNPCDNRTPGDTVDARERQNAQPRFMRATKHARIVHIDSSSFDGHVFNLQTKSGWYVAEGIITHNCRCVWRPVVKGFS